MKKKKKNLDFNFYSRRARAYIEKKTVLEMENQQRKIKFPISAVVKTSGIINTALNF